jgi:hypothetical protein
MQVSRGRELRLLCGHSLQGVHPHGSPLPACHYEAHVGRMTIEGRLTALLIHTSSSAVREEKGALIVWPVHRQRTRESQRLRP